MNDKNSLKEAYFDEVYGANTDPWNFETSLYEHQKYAVPMGALTKLRYQNSFEIGCSIGVLSRLLASRTDKLLAVDAIEAPLVTAKNRLRNNLNVTIEKMIIPIEFGTDQYDLIVISEVAYYLNDADLKILRQKTLKHLTVGGQLLMVHWTPPVHDYPQTGDSVHEYFLELNDKTLIHLLHERHATYRLDLFQKN